MPEDTKRSIVVEQALFVRAHLPHIPAERVILFLASAEPSFDRSQWFTSRQEIALARIGMKPTGESRMPISIADPSVAANWYHLCDTPREVWALHYQLGHDQLAIWRLARMWQELQ